MNTKQHKALEAAKEALIGHGAECKDVNDALALIDEALAATVQEPVAWQVNGSMVVREDWIERLHWPFEYVAMGRAIPDSWVPVLYTTPPAALKRIEELEAELMRMKGRELKFAMALNSADPPEVPVISAGPITPEMTRPITAEERDELVAAVKKHHVPAQPAPVQEPVAHDEDWLEKMYWEFDATRNKSGEERLRFKGFMRAYGTKCANTTPPAAQTAAPLTVEDVRKAGGIVHSDGNIFFTSIDQLNAAHGIKGASA